jgi:hypothetical protein
MNTCLSLGIRHVPEHGTMRRTTGVRLHANQYTPRNPFLSELDPFDFAAVELKEANSAHVYVRLRPLYIAFSATA